jgi:hypothetical protein
VLWTLALSHIPLNMPMRSYGFTFAFSVPPLSWAAFLRF